jgi:hypothetical protein
MNKVNGYLRILAIGKSTAAMLEFALMILSLVSALNHRVDLGIFFVAWCICVVQQAGGFVKALEDKADEAREEYLEDVWEKERSDKTFSERVEELNKKNNKQ